MTSQINGVDVLGSTIGVLIRLPLRTIEVEILFSLRVVNSRNDDCVVWSGGSEEGESKR